MAKCPICSQENSDYNTFCLNCGFRLNTTNRKRKSKSHEASLILSIFLPGISYFYLEQWYRGLLFFVSIFGFFFATSIFAILYDGIYNLDDLVITYMLIVFYAGLYIYQIYDIHRITKLINVGEITF